jgi:iron complex outermembrane recepter protein
MLAVPAGAQTASTIEVNLPSQPLESALRQLISKEGIQVLYSREDVRGLTTPEVKGRFTPEEVVQRLIEGTGLAYSSNGKNVFAIKPKAANDKGGQAANTTLLAQAQSAERQGIGSQDQPSLSARGAVQLEAITVTAQKRDERMLDVPVPVTSIRADALTDSNQLRLQDYYTRIPGLSLTLSGDGGVPQISIRGLMTGGTTNPAVGLVVDDVPYGSSTSQAGGFSVPDIDPSDLARVEVLRGPQGTLYGANSLGGLVKYVTLDPSTERMSGRVQVGTTSVHSGDEFGYNVRAAVNLPLSDSLAIRASAFQRREPGFIDNVQTGQTGINRTDANGGRLSALWRVSDVFSLRLNSLIQEITARGTSETHVQPGLGDLQQRALTGTGEYARKTESHSATITAQLGIIEGTSVTGYSIDRFFTNLDATPAFGTLTQGQFGVTGTPDPISRKTTKFTQEVRLSAPIGRRFDWRLGAFYTEEKTSTIQDILAANSVTGQLVGSWFHADTPTTYKEHALFADLTVHVTDRFDVQIGGRASENKQTYSQVLTGPLVPIFFGGPSPLVTPEVNSKDNAFTYLFTPRFKLSPDMMVYARFASGYRPGGPVPNSAALRLPSEYSADTTQNYEVGVKARAFNNVFFEASLYHIDWKDIQLQLRDPATRTAYNANGSRARSQGIELSVEAKPARGLTTAAWVAWSDAVLTEALPSTSTVFGTAGSRLPYSSRFSGNLSVDQEFFLTDSVLASVGGAVSYVGDRLGVFRGLSGGNPLPRQSYPAYTKVDLRAGVKYHSWSGNIFVNNVTDKRGILRGGFDSFIPTFYTYIQPRTAGVSITKVF